MTFCNKQKIMIDISDTIPTDRLLALPDDRECIVLLACGSFSPVTLLHLRIFEEAKNYLENEAHSHWVVGGFMSPVHHHYPKQVPHHYIFSL
jgi:nicotinamide mononucleotide adenylyltransferase